MYQNCKTITFRHNNLSQTKRGCNQTKKYLKSFVFIIKFHQSPCRLVKQNHFKFSQIIIHKKKSRKQ